MVAVIVSAVLMLNIAATLTFILPRNGFGLPVLAVVQVADIVATFVLLNLQTSGAWSLSVELSAGPALTLVGLAVLSRTRPRHSHNSVAGPEV